MIKKIESIKDLVLDPENANAGTVRGMAMIDSSIAQDGVGRGVAADRNGILFAGNKTVQAAVEKGIEIIPIHTDGNQLVVTIRDDLDYTEAPERFKRLAIADNRSGEIGLSWDNAVLEKLADEIDLSQFWTTEELETLLAEPEPAGDMAGEDVEPEITRAEELQQEYGTALGQVWQLGEHRVVCGDCTDLLVLQSVFQEEEKADLLFTDPPYGVAIGEKNRMLNSFQEARRNLTDVKADTWAVSDLKQMLILAFANIQLFCSDACSVFVCSPQGGELGMMMMMMMMMKVGLPVRHVLNWVKNAPTFSLGRLDYDYQHEPILFTWKKTHKRFREGPFQTSVWEVDRPKASPDHPTIKPVALPENAIANHTEKGDICTDPFLGSGTVLIACENLGRKCRGVEIDPGYVAVALKRWETLTGQQAALLNKDK